MPFIGLIVFAMWVVALIDVILAEEYRVRHLPKIAWVFIVILLPLVGSVIWFAVGRPEGPPSFTSSRQPEPRTTGFPEYERPEYKAAIAARDDEEFRRKARERVEEQRRKAREMNDGESPSEE